MSGAGWGTLGFLAAILALVFIFEPQEIGEHFGKVAAGYRLQAGYECPTRAPGDDGG